MRVRPLHLASTLVSLVIANASGGDAAALDRPALSADAMVVEPEGRAWMEARADHCFGKLAEVLDERGYSHALSLQWSVANPSIVDATEAFREEQAVDVALLSDGPRMHAVAPFLRHRRARALVRYAESMAELPDRRLCVFARSIQEDSAMQAFQRTLLVCIALVAFAGFALGLHRARRRMPER